MPDVLESPSPAPAPKTVIDCAAYCGGSRVADLGIDQIGRRSVRRISSSGSTSTNPSAVLQKVQKQFGLHDLAVEDAYNAHQRPKLELYEDSLFVVLRTAHMPAASRHLEFGETHIFSVAITS